jgi:hypothetical protein
MSGETYTSAICVKLPRPLKKLPTYLLVLEDSLPCLVDNVAQP